MAEGQVGEPITSKNRGKLEFQIIDIEDTITGEDTLLGGPERLVSYTRRRSGRTW